VRVERRITKTWKDSEKSHVMGRDSWILWVSLGMRNMEVLGKIEC